MNKILLIEDDQPMSWLVEGLLEKKYKITLKDTPIEALKWLESGNRPHLIISDLKMPDMKGTMFLQYLKESGFYENLPVLIITSYNALQMKQKCLNLGAAEYLEKPFNPETLVETVNRMLKIHN